MRPEIERVGSFTTYGKFALQCVELMANRSSLKVIETCANHQTTCRWRMRTMSTSTKCFGRKRTNKVSLQIAHF